MRLLDAADGAALDAADSLDAGAYGRGVGDAVPVSDATVTATARDYLAERSRPESLLSWAVAPGTGSPDGRTAVVRVTGEADVPMVGSMLRGLGGSVTITVEARARAAVSDPEPVGAPGRRPGQIRRQGLSRCCGTDTPGGSVPQAPGRQSYLPAHSRRVGARARTRRAASPRCACRVPSSRRSPASRTSPRPARRRRATPAPVTGSTRHTPTGSDRCCAAPARPSTPHRRGEEGQAPPSDRFLPRPTSGDLLDSCAMWARRHRTPSVSPAPACRSAPPDRLHLVHGAVHDPHHRRRAPCPARRAGSPGPRRRAAAGPADVRVVRHQVVLVPAGEHLGDQLLQLDEHLVAGGDQDAPVELDVEVRGSAPRRRPRRPPTSSPPARRGRSPRRGRSGSAAR